jgi:radical SAM superfamily enzyme YgiQ (UPF0313 family)
MKERVLLINPPGPKGLFRDTVCSTLSKASYVWKPRGHIMASAVIPKDWEVNFIDGSIRGLSQSQMLLLIKEYKPTLIITSTSSEVWEQDYEFISKIRNELKEVYITAFGDALREKYFFDSIKNIVDDVFLNPFTYNVSSYRNNPPLTFEQMYPARIDKGGFQIKTGIPRHELFDNLSYRWPFSKHYRYGAVYSQFGCPFTCSYCTSSRTTVTYRQPESILEEIEGLHRDKYKEIHFGDDTFGNPKDNTVKILAGMEKQKYKFSWSAYTYPGLVDFEFLKLMKATGCHTLVVGIDSYDFSLLKKYGRSVPRDILLKFIANCKKLNIDVCGDFILGFEEEDEEAILKTIKFAVDLGIAYASFNCANPLFGTSIREQKKEAGIIKDDSFGFDTAGYNIPSSKKISSERLKELHSLAVKRFYLRPAYLIKRLAGIRSLEELSLRFTDGVGVFKNALGIKS